jgi:hypothetical protein
MGVGAGARVELRGERAQRQRRIETKIWCNSTVSLLLERAAHGCGVSPFFVIEQSRARLRRASWMPARPRAATVRVYKRNQVFPAGCAGRAGKRALPEKSEQKSVRRDTMEPTQDLVRNEPDADEAPARKGPFIRRRVSKPCSRDPRSTDGSSRTVETEPRQST